MGFPFVCKRFKRRGVDLFRLRRRIELVMEARKEDSAICGVYGVGLDLYGNVLLLMERMAGDLRTLIDDRMNYLTDGQMPFEYTQTISMMLRIAQGMQDLHRYDFIHGDLKASNILVNPVPTKSEVKQVDGCHLDSVSAYFDVKVGDFENCDGIQGTAFWRAPEVLQAVKNRTNPIFSPAIDVYSYAMVCYELLTGYIPLGEYPKGNYDMVLSGQRPNLPTHVNDVLKDLLHACWRTEPGERPGWTSIIHALKEKLKLRPVTSHQSKKSDKWPSDYMPWEALYVATFTSGMCTPKIFWEEAFARQLHNWEEKQFITWKEKKFPELRRKILPVAATMEGIFSLWTWLDVHIEEEINSLWRQVVKAWTYHVCRTTNVVSMLSNASEPCNLLGSTAKQWLEEMLATSERWRKLWQTLSLITTEVKNTYQNWLFAWELVYNTFHDWHFESTIAFITWQLSNDMYLNGKRILSISKFIDTVIVKIYLEVDNGRQLDVEIGSVTAWKKFELEKVTIREYFLKNILSLQRKISTGRLLTLPPA